MTVWNTAYVNSLPNSSFAWIDPSGGRHLPYKDKSGNVDLPHVRNALARLNQVKGLPAETAVRIKSMLQNLLSKNNSEVSYMVLNALKSLSDSDSQIHWIQTFPYTTWSIEDGVTEEFTRDRAERMVENFVGGVRTLGGDELCLDYDHKLDPVKGGKAAGWIKGLEARDDGLYMGVEFTPEALAEVRNKEWRYISPSYYDNFDGTEDVFNGAGLTNQPVLKDIQPINFSELATLEKEVNQMPEVVTDPNPAPPAPEGDGNDNALDREVREALGIDEHGDIIATIKNLSEQVAKMDDLTATAKRAKELSEQFPDVAKRLAKLEADNREIAAREFSQAYARRGDKGLAPTALSQVTTLYKSGADASVLKNLLDDILDKGIVDFSERGTQAHDGSKADATNPEQAAKLLSEKMQALVVDGKAKNMDEALRMAATEEPDLWKLYQGGGE